MYKSKRVINLFKDAQSCMNEAFTNTNLAMVKNYCRAVALDMGQIIKQIDKDNVSIKTLSN